jgi:hypothetical protein
MLDKFFTDLGLAEGPPYITLVIGIGVALGVAVLGILLLHPKKPAAPPPPPPPPPGPTQPVPTRDPFTQGSGREARTEPRRRGGNVSVQIADESGRPRAYEGWVVDRSTYGLCLAVEEEFPQDTVLRVRPAHPDPVPWVAVRVRHCRRSGTSYEIGCQFLQPPNASVRMLFG